MSHLAHLGDKKAVLRVNAAVLGLVWAGLAFCAIAAVVYDIHHWVSAW